MPRRLAPLATCCALLCACPAGSRRATTLGIAAADPLAQLAAGSLADRITDPMVSIRHHRGTSRYFRAIAVVYSLDGLLLCALRLDRTRPPETELPVFDGRLRPGRHLLVARLTLEQFADERLSGEPLGRTQLDTRTEFVLAEGQFAAITAYTRESGPLPSPSLEFDVRFRPSRSD